MSEVQAGTMIGPFANLQSVPVHDPEVTVRRGIWELRGDMVKDLYRCSAPSMETDPTQKSLLLRMRWASSARRRLI